MRTKNRFGRTAYRVEWCSKLAFYEGSTDVDHDNCTIDEKTFDTLEAAKTFAEAIYPKTLETFGIVEVDRLVFESYEDEEFPSLGRWVPQDDHSLIFSGEWEE